MQKTYLLTAADREALVRYLGTRPYVEVAGAIQALMELSEAPAPKLQAVEDEAA